MAKILLLKCDWSSFGVSLPLGLLYLSSYLKKYGNHEVIIRDLNHQTLDDLWEPITNGDISIIGISMLSYIRNSTYKLITKIKNINPNIKIILGGNHTSSLYKTLAKNLSIDAVVIGEGEETMLALTNRIMNGEELINVPGSYAKGGEYIKRPLISDLDTIPFPDYGQIDHDWYKFPITKSKPNYIHNGIKLGEARCSNMITSRGCIGRCNFCDIYNHWGYKPRFRSAKNVVDEIIMLNQEYDINFIEFNDDSLAISKKIAKETFQKLIDENLKITWISAIRADCCLDLELLQLMKDSGALWLAIGVESGADTILKSLGKGTNKEINRQAIENLKKVGIKSYALMMCGNAGETDDTINETVQFLNETNPDIHSEVGCTWTYPGTKYCEQMGIPDEYWISGEDGLPVYYNNFTQDDLNKWKKQIGDIPSPWIVGG